MEERTGREQREVIKQINDEERLRRIAKEDHNAILLHDPDNSLITSIYGENCYSYYEDFLLHRLDALNGSLDKLCEELDYSPSELLSDWISGIDDSGAGELVNEVYNGERLSDLYD